MAVWLGRGREFDGERWRC